MCPPEAAAPRQPGGTSHSHVAFAFLSPPCSLSGKARGFFKSGDMVIVVTGWIPGSGHTNIMRAVNVP